MDKTTVFLAMGILIAGAAVWFVIQRPSDKPHQASNADQASPAADEAVRTVRDSQEVLMRMVVASLAFERTNAESALERGELTGQQADAWAARLAGAPLGLFGVERLEDKERAVLMSPTGAVPPRLLMELHWRVECVGVLAWAIRLIDTIPLAIDRFDYQELEAAIPHSVEDLRRLGALHMRPAAELTAMRDRLRAERLAAIEAHRGHETDEALSFRNSRSLERYRAINWLTGLEYPSLEGTPGTP